MSGNKFTSVILATMLFLSVFAGAFAGSVAAHSHGAEYDDVLEDNGLYWQDQTLVFDNSTVSDGDTLTLRKVTDDGNNFVGEYGADADGNVTINTEGFSGEYFLENNSGDELARFEVADQTFSVEVDNSTVYNRDDVPQHTADFEFESNRAGYDLVVESADFDNEDLETIFADADYEIRTDDDNEDYFVLKLDGNAETVTGNFSSFDTGNYGMTFIVEDTGLSAEQSIEVADPGDKNAQFSQNVYNEDQGDVFEFNVTLENTETAEVQLGNESYSGYEHNVTISNADDDTIHLKFDTSEAGDGDATSPWSLGDDTDATITPGGSETTIANALEAYSYDLAVSVGSLEKDRSTLELQERNTEGVTIHTMPKASDYELSDIQENATPVDEVANSDLMVVEVHASGVYANLDNDTTGADLKNGSTFATNNGFELRLNDTDVGANLDEQEYDVSNAKDVVVNEDENKFYVVFDSADFTYDDLEDGHSVKAYFNMTQNNPYIDDEDEAHAQSANASFEVVERTFEYDNMNDDDVVEVENSEEGVVSGTTTAAPHTEVTVNIRSDSGASTPFSMAETVDVQEDGTISTTFDLSEYDAGQEFTISIRDVATARQDATLVNGSAPADAFNVTFTVESEAGDALANASVSVDGETYTTNESGEVTVSLTENTTFGVDASADGYADTSQNVTVAEDATAFTITMAEEAPAPTEYATDVEVVDADGNAVADATVTVNGSDYTTDADGMASVSLVEGDYEFSVAADGYESASVTETIDANSTVTVELTATQMDDNQTEEPTMNDTDNTTETPTDSSTGGQPGFGVVLALIALVGAALVAHRQA